MQVNKEQAEKSEIKLTVELSAEEFSPHVVKAAARISETIEIPGFRKGQAPVNVVKQKVGEMRLWQQAAEIAIQKVLPEAVSQEKLETVGQPSINIEKLAPGNPFVFTAAFPILPEVQVADLSKIKVKEEQPSVTEAEVEKVVDNVRRMRATEKTVDREAKKGDKVMIKFDVFLDKVPIDGGSSDNYPLVLGENAMIPGFEEQIEGMKKEEEKEFELKFPDDYHNKQLAGKTCEFKVKLHEVKEIELPELNDEFAKTVGEYDSVKALKEAIEKNVFEEKKEKSDRQTEVKMIEELIGASTFGDIPEVMVNQETKTMMGELEQNVARQGLDFEQYLQHLKKDRKQLMLDLTPDAIKRIKTALVIRKLAKEQNIEATESEVKEEMDKMRHAYEGSPEILSQLESQSYKDFLTNAIRNKKTMHWLKEQVIQK